MRGRCPKFRTSRPAFFFPLPMTMPTDQPTPTQWGSSPTSRTRNTVQRYVNALLDDLAPERALTRGEEPKKAIELHRTPSGCVLQAEKAAVTVSWFSGSGSDTLIWGLHMVVLR